jgi:hypothetical protein
MPNKAVDDEAEVAIPLQSGTIVPPRSRHAARAGRRRRPACRGPPASRRRHRKTTRQGDGSDDERVAAVVVCPATASTSTLCSTVRQHIGARGVAAAESA